MPSSPSGPRRSTNRVSLLVITVAHFCVDSYATMLAPLLPLVMVRLDLNYTSAGLLGAVGSIANMGQPLLGMWADRMARRYLVIAGLLIAAIFSPLLGVAPSYPVLVVVLCLGGFGVAAFHPQVFSLAGELSGERRSFGLAIFIFGGTMALGCTPFWAPYYAEHIGLDLLPLVALPGLACLPVILRFVPLDNPHFESGSSTSLRQSLRGKGAGLLVITLVVVLRSISGLAFGFFLAARAVERGLSPTQGGVLLGIYNISGVVGSLVFGYLADRFSPKLVVFGTMLLSSPALYGYLQSDGLTAYVLLSLGGGFLLASNSILVAMAQELAPKNSGLASSLPLGFSWGLAGLFLPPIGYAADQIGMGVVLTYLALLPLVTAALALALPSPPSKSETPAQTGDGGLSAPA